MKIELTEEEIDHIIAAIRHLQVVEDIDLPYPAGFGERIVHDRQVSSLQKGFKTLDEFKRRLENEKETT